ncbi:uncharacterized protein LOC132599988 [Lycium barbarum]|uniref:uncharacterized protein LOC132599988 n=1 Tax=Lycium barbarum TaxID=112863 RepID=UPI00293EB3FF|nr:uncharacterized protein LOC132599988 [Lycium barbarum]
MVYQVMQWIILPPSLYSGGCIGFVIEPDNNNARYEYRVIRYFPRNSRRIKGEIFSSEKGRWTQLVVTSPCTLEDFRDDTKTSLIACGRMLYCSPPVDDFVLAFDPFITNDDQIVHIIDLPLVARDIPPYHYQLSSKLGVCRGRLRFVQVTLLPSSSRCIRVWELEGEYTMGKWTLVHERIPTFTLPQRSDDTNVFYVLAFHPNNEDLICCRAGNYCVVVYNLRTDKVESCIYPRIFMMPDWLEVSAPSCAALQVLPITEKWWPTPVRAL